MTNKSNEKEEYDVLPDDLLQVIARLKGRAAPQKGVPVPASILYPVSAAIRKAEEEALKNAMPGQEIPGHGVFIGTWQPKGLRQKFNVFAANEDLTNEAGKKETYTYDDTVKRIAELKVWHGFDGTNYENDRELYQALRNGSYDGGWFIPPRELLMGTGETGAAGIRRGTIVQPDNLYDHKDKGALKGSFCRKVASGPRFHDWYWSSTERRNVPSVWSACFSDSYEVSTFKDSVRNSCRPIRLEEVRLELAL